MAKSRGRKFAEITSPTSGVFDLTSVPTITNAKLQNSAMTLAGSSVSLGGTGVANTDALSEGSSNLYFTNARVQSFLGGGTLAGNIVVPDNQSIYLGSSSDFRLVHNTTNTQLINATGALQVTSNGGFDVTGAATFSAAVTASGVVTGTQFSATTTSTTAAVLKLVDSGVASYDVSFPDTSTFLLGVNDQSGTTSTKTFKLSNAGSGGFNLYVDGDSTFAGTVLPAADSSYNIGTNATRFANAYFDTVYGTVGTAAQTNITSVGTLTSLTVDDITINGSTISDAGGLTIDVAGDISLDADDGGHVRFKDGGTQYASIYKSGSGAIIDTPSGGDITLDSAAAITLDADTGFIDFDDGGTNIGRIENASSDFKLESRVQDKDIVLVGNDGGVGVEALRLDMSAAGAAAFNNTVTSTKFIADQFTSASGDVTFRRGGSSTARLLIESGTTTSGQNFTVNGQVASTTVDTGTLYVGNNNTEFSENNLYAKSGGHYYIDHNTVGQDFIFRVSNSSSRDMYGPRFFASGAVSVGPDNSTTSAHQMKINSTTMGLRIKSGSGGYSSLTWSGDGENTIGSITTTTNQIYFGSQNSGGTGSNGELLVEPRSGSNKRVLTLKSTGNIHGPINGGPLSFAGLGCFNIMDMEREWLDLISANSGSEVTSHTSTSNVQGPSMSHPGSSSYGYSKIKYTDHPTGGAGVVLESTAGNSSTWNGGWNSSTFTVDRHKPYLYTCYVRRTSSDVETSGTFYFGLYNAYPQGTSTTVDTNPYMVITSASNLYRYVWHLVYCMVYPREYNGTGVNPQNPGDMRGLWRIDNMDRRAGQTGWRHYQDSQQMRSYLYYSGNGTTTLQWARPGVWVMDGNQPTFGDLINAHGISELNEDT